MTLAARVLSWLFHPIFMPLITLVVAVNIDPKLSYFINEELMLINYGLIGIMTIAFPSLSIALLRRSGVISSFQMPTREERLLPFTLTLFYYILTYYLLKKLQLDRAIYSMLLGAMLALACTILITRSWKISIHMVGIGGLFGAVVALTMYHYPMDATYVIGAILLVAGAVGTARLWLEAHTSGQVLGGFVLGASSVFFAISTGLFI